MKIIDIVNPERVNQKPVQTILLSSENFPMQGFVIQKVELRLYVEKNDENLGSYSLITSNVETNMGSVEMIYEEGFLGKNPLNRTADFVTKNLGLSGLVLRSIITLQSHL